MASKKIPQLNEESTPDGTEFVNYVIDSTDRRITVDNLANRVSGGGDLYYAYRELTPAEIGSLFTTPVDIVPAQGVGKTICPHMMTTVTKALGSDTAWDSFTDDVAFKFDGGGQYSEDLSCGVSPVPVFGADLQYLNLYNTEAPAELKTNAALQVYFTTENPSAGGTKPIYVHVWYYIISV